MQPSSSPPDLRHVECEAVGQADGVSLGVHLGHAHSGIPGIVQTAFNMALQALPEPDDGDYEKDAEAKRWR